MIAPQICQAVISTVTVVKVAGVGNAYCGVCCIQDFLFKVLQLLLFNIPIACFIDPFSGASLLRCTVVYFIWLLGLSSCDMCLCAGVTTADKAVHHLMGEAVILHHIYHTACVSGITSGLTLLRMNSY